MSKIPIVLSCVWFAQSLLAPMAEASDHRSPLNPPELWVDEARLTGLFAFPDDDHLVVALCFFRDVDEKESFDFGELEFGIHFDLTTPVSFEDENGSLERYGGSIPDPTQLKSEASILFRLGADGVLQSQEFVGFPADGEGIDMWVGLRDDPFIFPFFDGKNVMACVVRIPFSLFPEDQQVFKLWGNSQFGYDHPHQVDHAGRALRTVVPRVQKLNFLPPSLHVEWLKTQPAWDYSNLDGIRDYDLAPDVVIYDRRRPAGFPNGRLLTDDVVQKVCESGDCGGFERSIIIGGWPRSTTNDKEFLEDFPYLAAPHPVQK